MNKSKQEKEKIYRFGNLILQYFPAVEKECVACYQLRTINNDARIEWDENTEIFKWIEYFINEKGNDKTYYEYFNNILVMYFNLACCWMPTPQGLNAIAKEYVEDVKRFSKASNANNHKTPEEEEVENKKIIEEEKRNYEMMHGDNKEKEN